MMKRILTWLVFIISACIFTVYFYSLDPSTPIWAFFLACFVAGILSLLVPCIYQIKWRHDNGVDLFATLETDEEKLKEHMLFIMQYHGVEENLTELNDIFRNYPQWHLKDWVVFRSWYKEQIDYMMKYPDIFHLSVDGAPYRKENDPLYDPNAPDWSLYDRNHYDDDDDYYNDSEDDGDKQKSIDAGKAIAFGIGLAAGLGITGDGGCGNLSSNNGDGCDCSGSA